MKQPQPWNQTPTSFKKWRHDRNWLFVLTWKCLSLQTQSTIISTILISNQSNGLYYQIKLWFWLGCRYQVQYDDGFDNVLVVDGVPVIDKSKLERLLAKVAKEFSKKGVSIKQDDIFVPWDNVSGKSKGSADTHRIYSYNLRITFFLGSCLLNSKMLTMPTLR